MNVLGKSTHDWLLASQAPISRSNGDWPGCHSIYSKLDLNVTTFSFTKNTKARQLVASPLQHSFHWWVGHMFLKGVTRLSLSIAASPNNQFSSCFFSALFHPSTQPLPFQCSTLKILPRPQDAFSFPLTAFSVFFPSSQYFSIQEPVCSAHCLSPRILLVLASSLTERITYEELSMMDCHICFSSVRLCLQSACHLQWLCVMSISSVKAIGSQSP